MHAVWRSIGWQLAAAGAAMAACFVPATAVGQVRVEAEPGGLVSLSPSEETRALFDRNGLFRVAGGVLPGGHAAFLLERNGTDTPVPVSDVRPVAVGDGNVGLRLGGITYAVDMPRGLACPLGQFVARDGLIAYTVPKYLDVDSRAMLLRAGLVRHRIAREFDGTPFETLLKAADFGATAPLPQATANKMMAEINRADGIGGLMLAASDVGDNMVGSFLNGGMQVTYRVYLMQGAGRVEIGGVPLRYYWTMEPAATAGVFAVEMYAQNWPAGSHLTDWTVPGAQPTQYDIVNFYQVAGMFRQLHDADPAEFAGFVDAVCGRAT